MSVRTEIKMQKWELSFLQIPHSFLRMKGNIVNTTAKQDTQKVAAVKSPIRRFVSVCTSPCVSVLFYCDVTRLCNKRHSCVPETRTRE